VESAIRADSKETGATWQANAALREAAFGNAADAKKFATDGLKLASGESWDRGDSFPLAIAGDSARAESLAEGLNKRFPVDTQMQSLWLPAIRAQVRRDTLSYIAAWRPSRSGMGAGCSCMGRLSSMRSPFFHGPRRTR
jgi:hypothetical protein